MKTEGKRAQRLLLPLLVLIAGVGLNSCYEDYGLTTQDYDTYLTQYATGTNFQSYKYFIMPDTVIHIYDTTGIDPILSARKFDKQILSLTASNFEARGYTRIAKTDTAGRSNATLVVLISQMSRSYVGYYYDYWWGYWGWYYPWYPGYYPPMYGGTYEYSTGTNLTMAYDLGKTLAQPPDASGKRAATAVWTGIITGLVGSASTAPTRITDGINKTFEQSPYLYAGQ